MNCPDGGPAFPSPHVVADANDPAFKAGAPGLSLRDFFAAAALQGMLAHPMTDWGSDLQHKPELAYRYADRMLQAREIQG